jgi:quercetin dioxygenase-like cupin family protein
MARSQDSGIYAGCATWQEKVVRRLAVLIGRVRPGRGSIAACLALAAAGLAVGIAFAASMVVVDTSDVRLRVVQSEFESGFDSGWHTHPGPVIVQVQEGTFKIYQGGCEPVVVHAGDSYIEVPFVPVRAVAKGRIVWTTSQILPVELPAQDPAVPPCQ